MGHCHVFGTPDTYFEHIDGDEGVRPWSESDARGAYMRCLSRGMDEQLDAGTAAESTHVFVLSKPKNDNALFVACNATLMIVLLVRWSVG